MTYKERKAGDQCQCGAKLVTSPKTQKVFCSNKCWLKKDQTPAQVINEPAQEKQEDQKWNDINWGKCKHGYLIEAFKKVFNSGEVGITTANEETLEVIEKMAEAWADMSMRNTKNGDHPKPNYPEQGGHVNEFPPDDEEAVEEGIRNM